MNKDYWKQVIINNKDKPINKYFEEDGNTIQNIYDTGKNNPFNKGE